MLSWDPTWEAVFRGGEWGKYPPEELIRFIARHYYRVPDRRAVRVLDLGCGPGPCSWFLAREGFTVVGIDGSPTAVAHAQARLRTDSLDGTFLVGDLSNVDLPDESFTAAIDVCAITHNRADDVARILSEARRVLVPGGRMFSLVFGVETTGFGTGEQIEAHTFCNLPPGPVSDRGLIHFFDEAEIRQHWGVFDDLEIDYLRRTVNNQRATVQYWIISARRS